jgi:hypothetical protein
MNDKTSEHSEQGFIFAPGEFGERPAGARSAGDFKAASGVLSFGDFSLDKQRQIRWDRIWTDAVCPKGEG